MASQSSSSKKSIKKKLAIGGGISVVGLLVLAGAAPTIAGSFAPGLIESTASKTIAGSIKVQSVSLSWFGPQSVSGLVLRDAGSRQIASVDLSSDAGLMSLIRGSMNLGVVRLGGTVNIQRNADGTTNLQQALAPAAGSPRASAPGTTSSPAPAASSQPIRVPDSLRANLELANLSASIFDVAGGDGTHHGVFLPDVQADILVGAGVATAAKINSPVVMALSKDGKITPMPGSGSFKVDGSIDNLIGADGTVHPDQAKANVMIRGTSIPTALLDLLSNQGGRLTAALGETAELAAEVKGDYSVGQATFTLTTAQSGTPKAAISGTLDLKNGVLSNSAPITAAIPGQALLAFAGDPKGVAGPSFELSTYPDLTVVIETLRVNLPKSGAAMSFSGAAIDARVQTAPLAGVLKVEGQAPKQASVTGLNLSVTTTDLAQDVRIRATGSATLDRASAGVIDADVVAGGLLNAAGAFAGGMPGKLDGKVAIKGINTAIIEPFVAGQKLVPAQDIGPTLDVELIARTPTDASRAGAGKYDVQAKIGSARIALDGTFAVTPTEIRGIDRPFSSRILSAGAIAHRMMPAGGWTLRPTGGMDVSLNGLVLPITTDAKTGSRAVNLSQAAATGRVTLFGMELANPADSATRPIALNKVDTDLVLTPGAAPVITLAGDLRAGNEPCGFSGTLTLNSLFENGAINAKGLAPTGNLNFSSLPVSLAGMFTSPAAPGEKPLDLAALATDILGPKLNGTITLAKAANGTDGKLALSSATSTTNIDALLVGPLAQLTQVEVRQFSSQVTLTPNSASTLIRTFMPDVTSGVALANPSTIKVAVAPVTIPLAQGVALSKVGEIKATVELPGQTLIQGLTRQDAQGRPIAVRPFGVENLNLTLDAPASIMASGGTANVTFTGKALSQDAPGGTLAAMRGTAQAELAPADAKNPNASRLKRLTASTSMTEIGTAGLDAILAKPGMVSGLLGPTASLEASVASVQAKDGLSTTITLAPKSQRVNTEKPLKFAILPDRFSMTEPARITAQLDPAFVNAHVFTTQTTGPNAGKAAAALTAPTSATMVINRLTLSKDPTGQGKVGPLKPGIFELGSTVEIPSAVIDLADGQTLSLGKTTVLANADKGGGPLTFSIEVASSQVQTKGQPPQPVQKLGLSGSATNLADASGQVSLQNAVVNAAANVPAFPTVVLDALGRQNGLLVEALGPVVQADLKAERVHFVSGGNHAPGVLEASMTSQRATMSMKGTVNNGTFIASQPVDLTISEITPGLSEKVSKNIPFIGAISKSKELKPGVIKATNFTLPLDGDMRKLSGDVVVDVGEALIAPGGLVNKLLKVQFLNPVLDKTGLSEAKKVGQRLKPVPINIREGVMRYTAFKLPLGEFEIENEGTVDLVKRQTDMVVWIPLGRLAGEAVPGLNSTVDKIPVIGDIAKGSFNELTMIPFQVRGPLDGELSRDFSPRLFADRVGKTLNPADSIDGVIKGIGDLFKKKEPEKK
ncbi:MAG: hypothetical protein KGS45_02280 [Planctomycetes bacterium]|nr:hypothetical protein [Planctomycetota bacterium]